MRTRERRWRCRGVGGGRWVSPHATAGHYGSHEREGERKQERDTERERGRGKERKIKRERERETCALAGTGATKRTQEKARTRAGINLLTDMGARAAALYILELRTHTRRYTTL